MTRRKIGMILAWLLVPLAAFAQHRYRAPLQEVTRTGFYRFQLSPQLAGLLGEGFKDLRISDGSKHFVPYFISRELPPGRQFVAFPMQSVTTDTSGNSVLVVRHKYPGTSLSELFLVIRNAAVQRYVTISGSNDGNNWYIIRERILMEQAVGDSGYAHIQSLQFPPSNYAWFRLVVDNAHSDPLNILQAGMYHSGEGFHGERPVENPPPQFTQRDSSDGNTYLYVSQQLPYPIAQLQCIVSAPLYERQAVVYELSAGHPRRQAGSFVLSSRFPVAGYPLVSRARELLIVIANGDNVPLKIAELRLFADRYMVYSYLEAGKTYTLLLGDSTLQRPVYDLEHFSSQLPANVATLSHGAITPVGTHSESSAPGGADSKIWLWVSIIAAILLLALLTLRLVKDVGRKN